MFGPGFRVIGEYLRVNWLDIESQIDNLTFNVESNWLFDFQYRVKLIIWLSISSQIDYLTFNIESNWLFDFQYRVNLTQIFSNYSESRDKFQFCQWLYFLGQNDSIFSFSDMHVESLITAEQLFKLEFNF